MVRKNDKRVVMHEHQHNAVNENQHIIKTKFNSKENIGNYEDDSEGILTIVFNRLLQNNKMS